MNTSRIITITAATLVLISTSPAQAQKRNPDGKTAGEKAAETAGKLLERVLGGGDSKQQKGAGKGAKAAERVDDAILAQQAQMFAGSYAADNGERVVISPAGAGCFVQMTNAQGSYSGVGFSVDGFFAASFDPGKQGGVIVYRIEGGKLNGTGVTYSGNGTGVLAENLEGPKKLGGDYKIASAAGADGNAYSGACSIKQVAENSYRLTWEVAGDKFYGIGFEMGPELWVSWSPKKDAFLTVFERAAGDPTSLARHTLFNSGKPPMDLAPVRLQQGGVPPAPVARRGAAPGVVPAAPPAPRRDKFGNPILQAPPGLEKPIDLPPGAVGKPMVGVAGGAPAAPAAPAPVLAPGQTAADLADKKSHDDGGGEVTLKVTNATRAPIRVNWLAQDGNEGRADDTIDAGASVEIGTTGAGHFFRARDAQSNALLQEFRVKNHGGKFHITITGAAPVPARKPGAAARQPAPAVAAAPAPAQPAAAVADPQAIAEFLKVHNDDGAEVGVAPLQWDPKLAAHAQEWASDLAARNAFDHRPNGQFGENIAGFIPAQGETPAHGAQRWYGEKTNYRPGSKVGDPQKGEITHYTQMVWRKTTHVGFGVAVNAKGMGIVVANYDPPGNFPEKPY